MPGLASVGPPSWPVRRCAHRPCRRVFIDRRLRLLQDCAYRRCLRSSLVLRVLPRLDPASGCAKGSGGAKARPASESPTPSLGDRPTHSCGAASPRLASGPHPRAAVDSPTLRSTTSGTRRLHSERLERSARPLPIRARSPSLGSFLFPGPTLSPSPPPFDHLHRTNGLESTDHYGQDARTSD